MGPFLIRKMDKILIDIDNNTPGAIIKQVFEYILPVCPSGRGRGRGNGLHLINKYFHKTVKMAAPCWIEKMCGQVLCKTHSPDFADMKIIQARIEHVKHGRGGWIHFDTKEQADKAVVFVRREFEVGGRCCGGLGLRIR